MPGTVSDVSATLVASTTRRPLCGFHTRCCAAVRLAREQRQDLDVGAQPALERVGGVADLALAGQEHEDVAGPLAQQLLDGVADRVGLVGVLVAARGSGPRPGTCARRPR